ncbi:putative hydrolase protein [Xylariaceae sp. FL0255]|nr:putative hydrolase protein [Xylariaceae sp. FL0255]
MEITKDPWNPTSHESSQTALLLLDYENAHVVQTVKQLLGLARKNGVAVIHCPMDTASDPSPTSKGNVKWHSIVKSAIFQNPSIVAQYQDFVKGALPDARETNFTRNPAHLSALTTDKVVPFLRKLRIKHIIMCAITPTGPVLGTEMHAIGLDFVVTIFSDACWDPDEHIHGILLEKAVGYMTG